MGGTKGEINMTTQQKTEAATQCYLAACDEWFNAFRCESLFATNVRTAKWVRDHIASAKCFARAARIIRRQASKEADARADA